MSRQERDTTVRPVPPTMPPRDIPPAPTGTVTEVRRETVAGPVTWEDMRTLLQRPIALHDRTWRPTAGGVLSILAGSWNLLLGLAATIGGTLFGNLIPSFSGISGGGLSTSGVTAGIVLIVIGVISIIGGAYAVSRKFWPMALAGSIAALIPTPLILPFIFGNLSLIFNVLGHREFWAKAKGEID